MSLNARFGSRVKTINNDAYKRQDPETRRPPSKGGIFKEGTAVLSPEIDVEYAFRMLPEPDLDYIFLPVKSHYFNKTKSSFPCPKTKGELCCVCDHGSDLWSKGAQDAAKQYWSKDGAIVRGVVRGQEDKGVQVVKFSYTNEKAIRTQMEDPATKEILPVNDLEVGYDLYFKKSDSGKIIGDKKINEIGSINFAKKPSVIHADEELVGSWIDHLEQNPIMDIFDWKSDAEMLKLAGITDDEDEPPAEEKTLVAVGASASKSTETASTTDSSASTGETESAAARMAALRSRMGGASAGKK